jgi:hypothetical protein
MGNGHEPVQGRPTNDGVEGEVDFCNVENDILHAEVLLSSECNRECDAPKGIHRLWAYCNTPGVTQGVHPGLPLLTYYHMRIELGKVHQTWSSRS